MVRPGMIQNLNHHVLLFGTDYYYYYACMYVCMHLCMSRELNKLFETSVIIWMDGWMGAKNITPAALGLWRILLEYRRSWCWTGSSDRLRNYTSSSCSCLASLTWLSTGKSNESSESSSCVGDDDDVDTIQIESNSWIKLNQIESNWINWPSNSRVRNHRLDASTTHSWKMLMPAYCWWNENYYDNDDIRQQQQQQQQWLYY